MRLARRDQEVFGIIAMAGGNTHAAAGFHAQQAVEKVLKALLCASDLDFPRTHDLESLALRLAGSPYALPFSAEKLRPLTPYAVDFRYDDEVAALLTEREMRSIVAAVVDFASAKLGAP
ncbi:MAG: HEPN domain-containing protein [Sulfuritalea sp.]|nr:HEPN domain-containing protein [Sulfuritalea sp.]